MRQGSRLLRLTSRAGGRLREDPSRRRAGVWVPAGPSLALGLVWTPSARGGIGRIAVNARSRTATSPQPPRVRLVKLEPVLPGQ